MVRERSRPLKVPDQTIRMLDRMKQENGIKTRTQLLRMITPLLDQKIIHFNLRGQGIIMDRKKERKKTGNFWEID